MLRADQINDRFVAPHKRRVHCVGRKKIPIARAQLVDFKTHAQFDFAAQYPMGLIFGVRVRAILCSRRVAPPKDAIAFAGQPCSQLPRIRRGRFSPSLYFNTHLYEVSTESGSDRVSRELDQHSPATRSLPLSVLTSCRHGRLIVEKDDG